MCVSVLWPILMHLNPQYSPKIYLVCFSLLKKEPVCLQMNQLMSVSYQVENRSKDSTVAPM